MMARRGVMGVLAGAAAAVLVGGCGALGGERSYRFRMTVEVETPQGMRTGSSVMEVSAVRQAELTSEARPLLTGLKGEAVAVDLPSGPAFVLLKLKSREFNTMEEAVTYALAPGIKPGGWEPFWQAMDELNSWFSGAKVELPRDNWPMIVRFRDIDDPKSVEKVDPEAIGVKRIVVETTSDDVTTGIGERLAWLGAHPEPRLDSEYRGSTNPTISQRLSHGDFRRGTKS